MFKKRKKYIAIFLLKEQNTYTVIKHKKFKPTITEIKVSKDKTKTINVSIPIYSKGLKLYYFIDIDKGQLFFDKKKDIISNEILDLIISKSIIRQLTMNLSDTAFKMNLMYIFIGLIIGGLIGWIAGGFSG